MSRKPELEPCPFCGSTNIQVPSTVSGDRPSYILYVRCLICWAEGPQVNVKHRRQDGERYAHSSRRPFKLSPQRKRWDDTHMTGRAKAIQLWNDRPTASPPKAVEQEGYIVTASGPYITKACNEKILVDRKDAEWLKEEFERINRPGKYTIYRVLVRHAPES